MLNDPELSMLLDQAARNLKTLEILVRSAGEDDQAALTSIRQRLHALKLAYTRETDALTRLVLERAVERRSMEERRRAPDG